MLYTVKHVMTAAHTAHTPAVTLGFVSCHGLERPRKCLCGTQSASRETQSDGNDQEPFNGKRK